MKPYTTTCGADGEDLRSHWRGNKNYRRKVADRAGKKTYRARAKNALRLEAAIFVK